jgi:hypothetical protein
MSMPDGFVSLEPDRFGDSTYNAGYVVNEISPFCDPSLIDRESDELILDQYYGQVYNVMPLRPAAIYGRTSELPAFNCDQLSNDGFLRVPFRRIPRRVVRNRAELEWIVGSIQSTDENLRVQFRGQQREHLITRSARTTMWLYGEDTVLEPSVQTSASRRKPALETIVPEWCASIRLFLESRGTPISAADQKRMTSSAFLLFALGLAQHYGLPTAGLDVTDRLDVALFFALMRYDRPPGSCRATYTRLEKPEDQPVIYVLAPAQRQQFLWSDVRFEGLPRGRPDCQSAQFIHIGWGYASNACARRIAIALYLDPDGDFGEIPAPADVFPPCETDLFAGYLELLSKAKIPGSIGDILRDGFNVIT